jgi:GNAT superfamily N-acetyltransferase/RimJ/RimL family protein N-acetyltransferase
MLIKRIDPADEDVIRACHAVHVAAQAADDPQGQPPDPLAVVRNHLTGGWAAEPSEAWYVPAAEFAAGEGPAAAWYFIELPDLENRNRAFVMPTVHPALRRRGIGRALIQHAQARAAASGREFLDGATIESSAGDAFARRIGAELGLLDARRILDLRKVPAERFTELKVAAEKHADGYSVISWTGATPEAELARVAGVINAMNDAPREEWFEDDIWDADRVRTRADQRVRLAGFRGYTIAAVHDATGEMAALTRVILDPAEPTWAHQGITAVTRPHRGHRLGLLVKAVAMEWLASTEPQLERIETTNSATNSYMIAVNEELGYDLAGPGICFFARPAS